MSENENPETNTGSAAHYLNERLKARSGDKEDEAVKTGEHTAAQEEQIRRTEEFIAMREKRRDQAHSNDQPVDETSNQSPKRESMLSRRIRR